MKKDYSVNSTNTQSNRSDYCQVFNHCFFRVFAEAIKAIVVIANNTRN